MEDGLPAAAHGAEEEEEEGRHAGQHLHEEVIGKPRLDVHQDVRVVVVEEERRIGSGFGGGRGLGLRHRIHWRRDQGGCEGKSGRILKRQQRLQIERATTTFC